MTGTARLWTLCAAAALALVALVPSAAQTHAAPRYGGTLVVGTIRTSDVDTLDPTTSASGTSLEIYRSICERLYEYDSKLQPVPTLAASLPVLAKDKLSYTVKLRTGIRFNDGTPFNAQAVVTTVQRYMNHPASRLTGEYASVASVTAPGPYTVVFHLKARDSTFSSNPRVLSPTQLAKVGDGFATSPVCVGPFMFDDRVVGDRVTVIKSPYYYAQKDVFLDKVVYKRLSSQESATAALKAGDIDVLDSLPTTELPGVRQSSSLGVLESPQLGWTTLFVNIGNTHGAGNLPYSSKGTDLSSSAKLRQAFEEALDRKTLVRIVFGGLYRTSCTLVAPANPVWYEATKVPCTPYDPKHARKLVAESGIAHPTVHLLTRTDTQLILLAQAIKAQEEAVGIDVVLESNDSTTTRKRGLDGDFDVYLFGLLSDVGDPHDTMYPYLVSSQISNLSGYSNPRVDLILNNAVKATEFKARAKLYRAAQQIVAGDRPMIPLYNTTTLIGFNTRVTGLRVASNGNVLVTNARLK